MRYLIILLLNFSGGLIAQEKNMFLSDFLLEDDLRKENVNKKYKSLDFSILWTITPEHRIMGMIGKNHQRIRIALTKVNQNKRDSFEYLVNGKSNVKNIICDFTGIIRIDSILEINKLHFGVDQLYRDSSIQAQGVLFATYEFKESPSQKHSGEFEGQLMTKWYINFNGEIHYDNIQAISDSYMNNAFVGTWTQYGSNESQICNWADYRIPYAAQDFDVGAAEFSPNQKYYEFGWKQYQDAWFYGNEVAKNNELSKWWE